MAEPLFPGTYVMPPPPQIQAMYDDPRLAGMKDHDAEERRKFTPMFQHARYLKPADPPEPATSRFVILERYESAPTFTVDPFAELHLVEEPNGHRDESRWGGGLGFDYIRGRHRLHARVRGRMKVPELFRVRAFLIASPRAVRLLQEFGVDQLETLPIEWTDKTDPRLAGYVFLDVLRLIDAYDYPRCELAFRKVDGRMMGSLYGNVWFRENEVDPSVHMFHDLYDRERFAISRALWHHLRDHDVRGVYVIDPASGGDAEVDEKLARLQSGDQ